MHPASKLSLDSFQLRSHSRFRCNAPDGEGSGLAPLPTVMGEAQEVERRRFSLSSQLSISGSITPELDQPGLLRMEFQSELRQPLPELFKESPGISFQLEAKHKSSRPGELHPQALTDPDLNVSAHPALIVQSALDATRANAQRVVGLLMPSD